jgi:hypothetical protein
MPLLQKFLLLWLTLLFVPQPLLGQRVSPTDFPATPNLGQITRRSGYIFAGTVVSIKRLDGSASDVASMQITFRVDRGIRGVRTGQTLTIREWSGLWQTGNRYRPGQRVMLFLYRPSKLGLTSPVGNSLGRMQVDKNGKVVLDPDWTAGFSADPAHEPRLQGNRLSVRDLARAIRRSAEE